MFSWKLKILKEFDLCLGVYEDACIIQKYYLLNSYELEDKWGKVKNIDEITELKSGIWRLRQIRRETEREKVPITLAREC